MLPGGDAVGMALSYSMLRRWGFTVEQVTVGTAATTVWNAFANVVFAVAAVGFLAVGGESHPLLTTAALIGAAAVAVAIALFAVGLQDDGNARLVGGLAQRLWNGVRRLLQRQPVQGWDERLVGFRREAVGLLRRRWLAVTAAHAGRSPHGLPRPARGTARRGRPERGGEPGRGVRRLGADPHHHHGPDHAGRNRGRGTRPDGRARLVRRPASGGRRGRAALPRAHLRAADRDRRCLPADLAAARRRPWTSGAQEADEGARTLDLRHGKATL